MNYLLLNEWEYNNMIIFTKINKENKLISKDKMLERT